LAAFKDGELTVPAVADARLSQPVFSLLEASDGRLWVGATAQGGQAGRPLLVRDGARWLEQEVEANIVFSSSRTPALDWAATKGGLFEIRSDGRTLKHETPVEPLHQLS